MRALLLAGLLLAFTTTDVLWLLAHYADAYGAPYQRLADLVWCESRFEPYALGDRGRSVGPGQWYCAPGNCLWLETPAGRAGVSRWDVAANVEMVVWTYTHRREWMPRWSCWSG